MHDALEGYRTATDATFTGNTIPIAPAKLGKASGVLGRMLARSAPLSVIHLRRAAGIYMDEALPSNGSSLGFDRFTKFKVTWAFGRFGRLTGIRTHGDTARTCPCRMDEGIKRALSFANQGVSPTYFRFTVRA